MTRHAHILAEVDAVVLRVVDAWIEEGAPVPHPSDMACEVSVRVWAAAPHRTRLARRTRQALRLRIDDIASGFVRGWPGSDAPFVPICGAHPDCFKSLAIARACWLREHQGQAQRAPSG